MLLDAGMACKDERVLETVCLLPEKSHSTEKLTPGISKTLPSTQGYEPLKYISSSLKASTSSLASDIVAITRSKKDFGVFSHRIRNKGCKTWMMGKIAFEDQREQGLTSAELDILACKSLIAESFELREPSLHISMVAIDVDPLDMGLEANKADANNCSFKARKMFLVEGPVFRHAILSNRKITGKTCRHSANFRNCAVTPTDRGPMNVLVKSKSAEPEVEPPLVQRFLVPADLTRLLEVAFTSYFTRNPQSLRYCKTPGCTQIYRAARDGSETDSAVRCPSCFSSVCSRCHEDGRGGLSCKMAQLRRMEDHDHETLSANYPLRRREGVTICFADWGSYLMEVSKSCRKLERRAQLEVQVQRGPGSMREDARRAYEREMEALQTRRMRQKLWPIELANETTQNEVWDRLRQRQTETVPAQAPLRHKFELEQEQDRQMRTTGWCCGVPFFRGNEETRIERRVVLGAIGNSNCGFGGPDLLVYRQWGTM
ncbi:hypothetical protein BDN71DRAFT_1435433 [Pleurotus eryngii]|uniref:IBR domain-containing protein n=1 Tax=Pleurotus eryngii TaxID=5323 RepID=A0A9P6D1Z7_PLEER|nr:hypothetical protein BDN71DRAFT_1435433 [Pleurotus eryngii]